MSTSSPPLTDTSITQGSVVEGMFVRALQPTGAFADELRKVGVDVKRLEPTYSTQVWQAALAVARRHVAPGLSEAAGYQLLGQKFIGGFFDTLVGRLVAVGLPLVGPDRTLQRLARTWAAAQPTLKVETVQEAAQHWRITLREPGIIADFCAGIFQGGLGRTGVKPQVVVSEKSPEHCVIQVRW
ncbi:DUF2378 family protein [Aggregicoccus sp. 17bor-14]|uniref:DUF2378 family protein n=1 Tax=Myxococcaceae TaxID=31 RepID=UPI00129CAF0A|nr:MULTISPECIES: DUF2378 family protein [Myxococcaceae]MBF5045213.1 DUF2378 family protein [Simulacricoccus sp. 17bor-14]MRI90954.1 DUF2378 family protein [Aggregicoccus sp. 17bor-14]